MMKRKMRLILAALAALTLAAAPALAQGQDALAAAQAYAPSVAVLMEQEYEHGMDEFTFSLDGGAETLEVAVLGGQVLRADYEVRNDRGAAQATLDSAGAQAQLLALYPEATVDYLRLEADDGLYRYEIAFTAADFGGVAYVHPESGQVLQRELVYPGQAQLLTLAQAQSAALERAGEGEVVMLHLDTDDQLIVYTGEINGDGVRYEFEMNAQTGAFLEWERKARRQTADATAQPAAAQDDGLIGTARAKEIAQERAPEARVLSIKLDWEDGRQIYEGELADSRYEYEFEIDAQTGEILQWEQDRLDD